MYPGNESEKPVLRDVINNLKKQNNINRRAIHVADKGLNCAQNIAFSKTDDDGYLFSKTVKGLPVIENEWVLLEHCFNIVKDKSGKVLYRYKSCSTKGSADCVKTLQPSFYKMFMTYCVGTRCKHRQHILYMRHLQLFTPCLAKFFQQSCF